MSNADAFLRAIADAPDHDAPRLVFADWLDEHGDPAWAAFIRSQVELATLDEADPRYPETLAQSRRTGMLTRPPLRPFADHVPGGQVMFRRGLIAGVRIPSVAYFKTPFEAWEGVPFERLWLDGDENGSARWSARPELTRVRTLALSQRNRVFPAGPHLTNLRHLRLDQTDLVVLMSSRGAVDLSALESLHLRVPVAGWRPMVQSCPNPLRRLLLHGDIEPELDSDEDREEASCQWLTTTSHWPSLETLVIRHQYETASRFDVHGMANLEPLAAVFESGRIRHLSISPGSLGDLVGLPTWQGLHTLEIGQDLDDEGEFAPAFAASPLARQLRSLRLGFWDMPRGGGGGALGPSFAHLRELRVRWLPYGMFGDVLAGPYGPHLLRLTVDTGVLLADFAELERAPFPQLRQLVLGGYDRDPLDVSPLCRSRSLPNLCTLVLAGSWQMTPGLAEQLARAPGLPHLSLVGCYWQRDKDAGWFVLGEGRAHRVRPEVLPVDCDWWEHEPDEDWR